MNETGDNGGDKEGDEKGVADDNGTDDKVDKAGETRQGNWVEEAERGGR